LRYDTDYVININTKIERLSIGGGRNVVIIGGHISTPDRGVNPKGPGDRWGLWLDDNGGVAGSGELVPGRVVHVEGVLIDGVDLSDAINIRGASVVLQLQNMRTGLSAFRSENDKNGTGVYGSGGPSGWTHADSFQPHGGLRELRTDRVTMITGYQGIFTKNDGQMTKANGGSKSVTSRQPTYRLSRTNVRLETFTSRGDDPSRPGSTGSKKFTGHTALWIPVGAPAAQLPGRFFLDQVFVERGSENPTKLVWPRSGSQTLRANGDGSWSYPSSFTHPVLGGEWVRNWDGNGSGKFWAGRPAGGDWAPAGVAGVGYRSPGYQN
jgi:hypothetical protein